MTPLLTLVVVGLGLAGLAAAIGGRPAAIGGGVAVAAQLAAVVILRPAMGAPQPVFLARWLGGMGLRVLALGALLVVAVARPGDLPPLPASLGYLGTLLPLLFTETRFLK